MATLKELFLDVIRKNPIFEMAMDRAKAEEKVTSLSPQIMKHLIKLFVFNSKNDRQHWVKEIDSWLNQIQDIQLKSNKKNIPAYTLYQWFLFDSAPHYDGSFVVNTVRKLTRQEYKDVQVYDYSGEHVMNQIIKILENVFDDIENDMFFTIENYLP